MPCPKPTMWCHSFRGAGWSWAWQAGGPEDLEQAGGPEDMQGSQRGAKTGSPHWPLVPQEEELLGPQTCAAVGGWPGRPGLSPTVVAISIQALLPPWVPWVLPPSLLSICGLRRQPSP
ncbi:hypothetical protein H1C71_011790 [Ictidomys tridecemlineatus]|nr:hypothetical protein H1C71_011790 [Ictidomys tridecemlineatus]KAG3288307.1 hypothetical protein H1C71_011790 [Ictidomys tridecemlineatus]